MNKVTLNGKDYDFRFSYKALKNFMSARKKSFNDMDDLSIEDIAYVGLFGIQSVGVDITIEQIEDALDSDFSGLKSISEAMAYDMESFTESDGKKKKAG